MSKFLSDEYFAQLQAALAADPKWTESTKSVKTTVEINVTDQDQHQILGVEGGVTTVQKVAAGTPAEFTFDGTYDTWTKVSKGEMDFQSAVLKGQLRFKGSITKILVYRDRFLRIADLMREVPKEY